MRIVDLTTFAALPAGTVFAKYRPTVMQDLCIKGETLPTRVGCPDFYYQPIADAIRCADSEEFADLLDEAQADGISVPMDFECESRDGLFERDQLFAVFEPEDTWRLIQRLETALSKAVRR